MNAVALTILLAPPLFLAAVRALVWSTERFGEVRTVAVAGTIVWWTMVALAVFV